MNQMICESCCRKVKSLKDFLDNHDTCISNYLQVRGNQKIYEELVQEMEVINEI